MIVFLWVIQNFLNKIEKSVDNSIAYKAQKLVKSKLFLISSEGLIMNKLLQLIIIFFALSGATYASVNINTASQAELEALKGIGPAKAKAIVEYRNQHGLFSSIDELEKVSGIGAGTIQQLRDELTVGDTASRRKGEKIVAEQAEETNP